VADLVIRCHGGDLAHSLELAADQAVEDLLVGFQRQEEVGPLLLELPKNGRWDEVVRLDQHTLVIQLAKELAKHRPLVDFARSGIAGLADDYVQYSVTWGINSGHQ